MEYAPNGSLRQLITTQYKKMDETRRRTIVADILIGVRAMHKQYVAHRDLKPENILLSSNNRMKICDFGQAKKFSWEGLVDLAGYLECQCNNNNDQQSTSIRLESEASFFSKMFSHSEKMKASVVNQRDLKNKNKGNGIRKGSFVGTRDFLSPEMVGELSISGPFSDLWAIGIICYQLYTGRTPWGNTGNQLQILEQIADPSSINYPASIP